MTAELPPDFTVDDIAPEDLRIRAENVTAALAQLRVTLLPLCDLADELLHELNDAVEDAELRLRRDGENDFAVIDNLDEAVGARSLANELHLIHEASDYELMFRGWRSGAVAHLRAVD